uniref:Uncharacterized protein n=1 Tax=Kalanchoe fedtschenkoi TaxID=63787 RepID=A0A7N0UDI2_KALFE
MAAIVSPQFVSPQPVDLAIVRKFLALTEGSFGVTDAQGNPLFRVKDRLLHIHDYRVILDVNENPVMTLRKKLMTMHSRWQVFRGDSTEDKDLLFTVKETSMVQLKAKLDVFLAHNKDEKVCDYKVRGSFFERSCMVYAGETSNIVAQMHKKMTAESILLDKTRFNVTVYPNIDYAFITAIMVILDEINRDV